MRKKIVIFYKIQKIFLCQYEKKIKLGYLNMNNLKYLEKNNNKLE